MHKDVFRFKHFECHHSGSSMKIGVDAVLVGAWADVTGANRILDVGCGCGVIALMCAQRNGEAEILAVDIDLASVEEAAVNFSASPWSDRLTASHDDFNELEVHDVDLIVSNPPYFDSGVSSPDSVRLMARHESTLGPVAIVEKSGKMLSSRGKVAMVIPDDRFIAVTSVALANNLCLARACRVRGHDKAPVKRVLVEYCRTDLHSLAESCNSSRFGAVDCMALKSEYNGKKLEELHESLPVLTLEISPGIPTESHRALCGDFYLKY